MTIGERIKNRRIELGMTQAELAAKLGYTSRTSICSIEKGKEDLTTNRVSRIAEALETTPGYLMGWENTIIELDRQMEIMKEKLEKQPQNTIDAILFNNNKDVIKTKDNLVDAIKLYELYEKADPTVKAAIDTLLKKN